MHLEKAAQVNTPRAESRRASGGRGGRAEGRATAPKLGSGLGRGAASQGRAEQKWVGGSESKPEKSQPAKSKKRICGLRSVLEKHLQSSIQVTSTIQLPESHLTDAGLH